MSSRNTSGNDIIIRFFMRQASEEDIMYLENWLDQSEENREYFEQIQNTWNSIELEKELDEFKIRNDYNSILKKIDGGEDIISANKSGKINFWGKWLLKVAAIFILGFFTYWFFSDKPKISISGASTNNVIETPRGSRATIQLPDGSRVILNAESKLTYPQQFKDWERKVSLEGEAFFEIKEDNKKQFLVKTEDITVKVFGTSFNVKSYPNENTTETTLIEGSISIYKNSLNADGFLKELKMEPNQRIVLYKEPKKSSPSKSLNKKEITLPKRKAKLVLSKHIDTDRFISWREGQLKIESESMNKLAQTLERRYDVKIHFKDEEIKQFRFSGTFKNETIEQVLAAIKLAAPIEYQMEDRDIWISTKDN